MPKNSFYIGPLNSGLEKNTKPFMIADDAFEKLQNAYVYRGYIRKRFGSLPMNTNVTDDFQIQQFTRLRIDLGNTSILGVAPAGPVPGNIFKVGQMFSIGASFFTVVEAGNHNMITNSGTSLFRSFDTATGNYVLQDIFYPNTPVYWYPSEPVMGFATYETNIINDELTYAFDTQFAYNFTGTAWARLAVEAAPGDALWTSSRTEFMWHTNYRGANVDDNILFVTNFNATNNIRYWNGAQWATFRPAYLAAVNCYIETSRIIIPFKDRLLLLNTVESVNGVDHAYRQRCRYSANGSPFAINAWREDIPGQGDLIDAPTKEQIVSAQLFKDRLIVFFERSTWEISYTGNQLVPFVWQKINSELGVESPFSTVQFDKAILGLGQTGIHACSGTNVTRIDAKIPDDVFQYDNDNDSAIRVQGVRDYYAEQVYWTIPNPRGVLSVFPRQVLVFNYKTNSWAYNDDTITAFGYYQRINDLVWRDINVQWQNVDIPWNLTSFEGKFRSIIAGNQQGWTFILDPNVIRNSQALQITDVALQAGTNNAILTIIDHNLEIGDFVYVNDLNGINNLQGIYKVGSTPTIHTLTLDRSYGWTGIYNGRGTVERVAQISIVTKDYDFFASTNENMYLSSVDFNIDKVTTGIITADAHVSSSTRSIVEDSIDTGTLLGSNKIEMFPTNGLEISQKRLWRTIYYQSAGESVQLKIYISDDDMLNENYAFSDFQLNAFIITAEPTGTL